jgi:hypothetical protein
MSQKFVAPHIFKIYAIQSYRSEILCSHGGEYDDVEILGCDAV